MNDAVGTAASVPQVTPGTLRALAVAFNTRLPVLPDVPAMAEAGFPDIVCDVWEAVFVPAGTPKEIIALLNREITNIVALPAVKERFAAFGFQPFPSTPEDAAARLRTDSAKWAKVILAAGIKAEYCQSAPPSLVPVALNTIFATAVDCCCGKNQQRVFLENHFSGSCSALSRGSPTIATE
jgi:hypothetical protein